jgi:acetylglutamate kinase
MQTVTSVAFFTVKEHCHAVAADAAAVTVANATNAWQLSLTTARVSCNAFARGKDPLGNRC